MENPSKILVVDAEADIRKLLQRALKMKGYEVLAAGSALDALVALQDNTVKLMITDIRMPDMDGLDLMNQAWKLTSIFPQR